LLKAPEYRWKVSGVDLLRIIIICERKHSLRNLVLAVGRQRSHSLKRTFEKLRHSKLHCRR
jgi:hypothetical protein